MLSAHSFLKIFNAFYKRIEWKEIKVHISKALFRSSQWYPQLSSHNTKLLNTPPSNGQKGNSTLLYSFPHFRDTVDFCSAYFSLPSGSLLFSFYVGEFFCI